MRSGGLAPPPTLDAPPAATARAATPASCLNLDLVALFSLMGNDYLPKVLEASFERLWRGYNALRTTERFEGATLLSPERRSFNWPFLGALLRVVRTAQQRSKAESEALIDAGATPSEARVATAMVGLDEASLAELVADALADVEAAAAASEAPATPDTGSKRSGLRYDVEGYLAGVLWVVQMYADGVCPDFGWEYAAELAPGCEKLCEYSERARRLQASNGAPDSPSAAVGATDRDMAGDSGAETAG
eukprot:161651-Prymnesium_polylepis.1